MTTVRIIPVLTLMYAAVGHAQPTENQVVLATPEFNVTTRDFEYYIESNVPAPQRDRTLAREGAVREAFENMYVIRAFAEQAEDHPGIDPDEIEWLTQHYRERLLMNRLLDIEVAEAMDQIDWQAAAREEYIANPGSYQSPERVDAAHILITTADRSAEEAESIAKEVLAKLEEGADFEELAREYSEDPSAQRNGGQLGFFARGQMVKPFEDAAFAMTTEGELSEPVLSQFGYHIIRFNSRTAAEQRPFEAVEGEIRTKLERAKQQEIRAAKINDIKSGAVDLGLQVNTTILESIEADYAATEEQ